MDIISWKWLKAGFMVQLHELEIEKPAALCSVRQKLYKGPVHLTSFIHHYAGGRVKVNNLR
jgi:hypothetical protein